MGTEWAIYLAVATAVISGGIAGFVIAHFRYERKGLTKVDRTPEERPLNVFDAYSDDEIQQLRNEAAKRVKYNRKNDLPNWLRDSIEELRKIDDEIEARKNAQLALEETKRTEQERDIAIFDTVYGHLLKDVEKKEIT